MKQEIENVVALVNKMGWYDMPFQVVMGTVSILVTNYCSMISDTTGDQVSDEEAVENLLKWEPKDIWAQLFYCDYTSHTDKEAIACGTLMKGEIEVYMKMGYTFYQACKEWDVVPNYVVQDITDQKMTESYEDNYC